jgi:hypothetical protein
LEDEVVRYLFAALAIGFLVRSYQTTSLSGMSVWVCIYELDTGDGREVQVVQKQECEYTKYFY